MKIIGQLRIKDWVYILGIPILGFFYLSRFNISYDFALMLIVSSLYLSHGYMLNDCFENIFGKSKDTKRKKIILSYSLLLLNCVITYLYLKSILPIVLLGSLLALVYSSRMKKNIISNIFLNSLGFSLLFLIGVLSNKPIGTEAIPLFLYVYLAFIPAQIMHILAHMEKEKVDIIFDERHLLMSVETFLLIFILWSFIIYYVFSQSILIFISTLVFSSLQIYLFEHMSIRKSFSVRKCNIFRNYTKVINIGLGISLLLIFIFL